MCCEVTVTVKNDEKTLKTDYLIYEPIVASQEDPFIKDCIDKTLSNFADEHDSIGVRIKLQVV